MEGLPLGREELVWLSNQRRPGRLEQSKGPSVQGVGHGGMWKAAEGLPGDRPTHHPSVSPPPAGVCLVAPMHKVSRGGHVFEDSCPLLSRPGQLEGALSLGLGT